MSGTAIPGDTGAATGATTGGRLRVALRCDAAVGIGAGHVMRCLTLADALAARGADCLFLCRPHEGHLIGVIGARGHRVVTLSPPQASPQAHPDADPSLPAHAGWLGASWSTDAAETAAALGPHGVDWLIVDHYALERRWEQALRPSARRIMVIDDLADRAHDCDLLLDQNLGRRAEDYAPHVPPAAVLLIGPANALLRPDFAAARPASLARRGQPVLRRLLITMGGVDQDNVTGQVLAALKDCTLPDLAAIEVVLGTAAPHVEAVRAQAGNMPWPVAVRVGIDDMPATMTRADLAIGAAGGTSWERCCLGLPAVQIVLAENQRSIAEALRYAGAAKTIKSPDQIAGTLKKIYDSDITQTLRRMSRAARDVCDGQGTFRVADHIIGAFL